MWIGLLILPRLIAQLGQNYGKLKEWHEFFRNCILFCTHFQPDIHANPLIFLNFALAELSTEVELPAQSTN